MDRNPFSALAESSAAFTTMRAIHETASLESHNRRDLAVPQMARISDVFTRDPLSGPMPLDANGCIVHEGLQHPHFILDCMAWDLIDDYTGVWKTKQVPPLHYFNSLRSWIWSHGYYPGRPTQIRDVPLPDRDKVMLLAGAHETAMAAAYALWSEEYFEKLRHDMFRAQPLPTPSNCIGNQIWTDERLQPMRSQGAMPTEQPHATTNGGVPLPLMPPHFTRHHDAMGGKLGDFPVVAASARADSVMTGIETPSASTSDQRGAAFSRPPSGSPTKLCGHARRLSALASNFQPGNTPSNLALNSRAALPHSSGQLPGTFDVLTQLDKRQFVCLMVSDVPFNVTVNEILTHLKLGEREGLVNYGPDSPAIHIIQDRSDSKTHEVYVEMLSFEVAARVIRDMPRRGIKIGSTGGSRKIRVELCSQDVMMRAIFPRPTRSHPWQFRWMGYDPDLNAIPDSFIGYISPEDLHNAREWAEHPRKAKHAEDAPQRVYEFMISTLIHLPKDDMAYGNLKGWRDSSDFVDRLFTTVAAMIKTLNSVIDDPKLGERHVKKEHVHLLNFRLLKRFNQTCFDFPLFSDAQREQLLQGL